MVSTLEFSPANGMFTSMWLLIALPLAGAAILFLAGKRADKWGHLLGCATVIAAFALGLTYFLQLQGIPVPDGENASTAKSAVLDLYTFASVGGLDIKASLLIDPLSAIFVLLITGVGSLIHIYAVGYMSHDPERRRFFAYFNLFLAAMLLLVLGNNYVMMFFGWEGVGLASYLLISFWYTKPAAATAGKKAFLMNRVGDAGFLLAIFTMFLWTGSTDFSEVFNSVNGLSWSVTLALGIFLLIGACGKSGQFPLQAWLPDAMEGPTPVSALIHAATMVTAGVYLIARSHPIFSVNPTTQVIVVSIGALTLLIGSIIGCAKDDIKRVLAYSTVSQIGYMFLAVGLGGGAYALGIIHLLAHGFFKAGLFLGAGSVMHGMNDQTNIRRFGGLWKHMKITWVTFGLGYLAIIGLPPLSGFFTKDPIILAAFNRPGWQGWLFGSAALLGAGLTAFYMTRLFILTFHGPKRWTEDVKHPHESPAIMTVPLILLAIGSVASGWIMSTQVVTWLEPVFGPEHHATGAHMEHGMATALTMGCVVVGVAVAALLFLRGTAEQEQSARTPVVRAARANLYADRVNELVFELPGRFLTRALVWVDGRGVDGIVNGLAAAVGGGSARLRRAQTGFVRSYALSILSGAVVVTAALLVVTFG